MIEVPQNKIIRGKWEEVYGLSFTIRCNSSFQSFVCRSHVYINYENMFPIADQSSFYWIDSSLADHVYYNFFDDKVFPNLKENESKNNRACDVTKNALVVEVDGIKKEIKDEIIEDPEEPEMLVNNASTSFDIQEDEALNFYLTVADESRIDCPFCFQSFKKRNINLNFLKCHLIMFHKEEVKEIIESTASNEPLKKPFCKVMKRFDEKEEELVDKLIFKFFVQNGLPFESIKDTNLNNFLWNLNSSYHLPTVDEMHKMLYKVAAEIKNEKIKSHGPFTIAIDSCKSENSIFIAFSLIFFRQNKIEQTFLFRELPIEEKITVPYILNTVYQNIRNDDCAPDITNIVTTDPELEQELINLKSCENVFLCFFTQLSRFVDELIDSPNFKLSLDKLIEFVKNFPNCKRTWRNFLAFTVTKRFSNPEIPGTNFNNWFSIIDFLTKCLQLHKLFNEFSTKYNLSYITVEDHIKLVYLHSVLSMIRSTVRKLATEKMTILIIVPTILEINKTIETSTLKRDVFKSVNDIFVKFLKPLIDSVEMYRFAVFLHPFYTGSLLIFSPSSWMEIQRSVCTHFSIIDMKKLEITKDENTKNVCLFQSSEEIEAEVNNYVDFTNQNRVEDKSTQPIDWWNENGKYFPRLEKLAKELMIVPAFSIDANYYFGKEGKFSHALSNMEKDVRTEFLHVAGGLKQAKARGEFDNKTKNNSLNYVMNKIYESEDEEDEYKNNAASTSSAHKKMTLTEAINSEKVSKKNNIVPANCSVPNNVTNNRRYWKAKVISEKRKEASKNKLKSWQEMEEIAFKKIKLNKKENDSAITFNDLKEIRNEIKKTKKLEDVKIEEKEEENGKKITNSYPWKNAKTIKGSFVPIPRKIMPEKKRYFVKVKNGKNGKEELRLLKNSQ